MLLPKSLVPKAHVLTTEKTKQSLKSAVVAFLMPMTLGHLEPSYVAHHTLLIHHGDPQSLPSPHPSTKSEEHSPAFPSNRLIRVFKLAGALILEVAVFLVVVPLQAQNTCLDGGFDGIVVRHAGYVIEAVFGIGE